MIDPRKPDFKNPPASPSRPAYLYRAVNPSAPACVSIVTPFFNTGEEFHETARSVFGQSLQQWEWIIVNDASTDARTLEMLQTYRTMDPRIRVLDHDVNRGLSASRNTGFRAARTEYVVLLDSDDLLEPTAIEKWFWHLVTLPDVGFVKGFSVGFGAQEYLWTRGFHEHEAFLEENLVDATSMVRRSVHEAIGGFDETTRDGLEDWEYWLHAASTGVWGSTIPEYLDWYRRRASHTDRWSNLAEDARERYRQQLQSRYPRLWDGTFPHRVQPEVGLYAPMDDRQPAENLLQKSGQRLLMILPWLALGGADKFNLDVIRQLRPRGWEVSIATTAKGDHTWLPEFAGATPDVFALSHFLSHADYPRFLTYLIRSRQIDAVLVSNSEFGYRLLPYLRSQFPDVLLLDYCHMEEEGWDHGGYPRFAVQMQELLDVNIVSSSYLKTWETRRGGDPARIEVCTTNVDTGEWHPDEETRVREREAMRISGSLPVILYPGRIVAQKQPQVFLQTVRLLRQGGAQFRAIVAGDGPELEFMKQTAREWRLEEAVSFLGAVPNERIKELMMMADVLFLPSKWEGISLTIYEAMAAGLAVVGAAVGGQAELVTEGSGILIQPSTPEAEAETYAKELRRLLDDPAYRSRLQHEARARVEQHFSLTAMGDRLEEILRHARDLQRTHPRPAVAPGLARSTAVEALAAYRNRPQRWWYAGLVDAAQILIRHIGEEVDAGLHDTALVQLRTLRAMFVRAEDHERVKHVDAHIERVAALAAKAKDPEDHILVSVVIPCYNQAQFLREAIESVARQTETRWEVIVVNDGSPDDTSPVVEQYRREHPELALRLIEQENRGLPAARNAGCAVARGEYLLPLDADDRIAPTFMARCLREFGAHADIGFVYSHIRRFGEVNEVFALPPFDAETIVHKDNSVAVCALMRKKMWEEVGGYNETMTEGYEDWDFWVGCIEKGWKGVRVPEPLFEYRIKKEGGLLEANKRRMHLIARIVLNHPALYPASTLAWAKQQSAQGQAPEVRKTFERRRLRIVYLIHNIQGVTGGNLTLLAQANALVARGHQVSIVTYSEPPGRMPVRARVIRVPSRMSMASATPEADVVIATYFLNAMELPGIEARVKLYFAQGDQFVFSRPPDGIAGGEAESLRNLRKMSAASYALPGVQVVANSANLRNRISALGGAPLETIVPVCVDRGVFHPVPDQERRRVPRILIVGPDSAGTPLEPLSFKGIGDIHSALRQLTEEGMQYTAVRISSTPPEIFADTPCEFHIAPDDAAKTRLFGTADILVYASHYDSCPRPPLEGMAAGVAVVCTDTDGAREYCVHGENAILVPPSRPDELANAVRRVWEDDRLRARLVQGGLRTAEQRPVEREWETLEGLILEQVQERGVPPQPEESGMKPEASRLLTTPRTVAGGREYAQFLNRSLLLATGNLCVLREGNRLPEGSIERLMLVMDHDPRLGIVAPIPVEEAAVADDASVMRYAERVGGRRIPIEDIPGECFFLRGELVGIVGLFDESLASPDEVLADYAYRVALAGFECCYTGDAVLVPSNPGTVKVTSTSALRQRSPINPSDRLEMMKREVLHAVAEALELEAENRVDDAATRLSSSLERFPESPKLHATRAWMLLRAGRYAEVSELLPLTPEAVKRNREWLDIAGFAMLGMGERDLARQCVEKALGLDPGNARALRLTGMIHVEEGEPEKALEAFRHAVECDRTSGESHAHLGALLWGMGEREEAYRMLEHAFLLSPTIPEVLGSFRGVVQALERESGALRAVADARRFHPAHGHLAYLHAEFLASAGHAREALDVAVECLARFGPEDSLLELALTLRDQVKPAGPAPTDGLSLCMIVKNEESMLASCLAGASGIVDEMIVVDTGSTDRTPMVAAACGARVFSHPWQNNYAEARNAALNHASGGWILVLDADERIAMRDRAAVKGLLEELRREPAAVVLTTRNYVHDAGVQGWEQNDGSYDDVEAGSGWVPSDKVRLFPHRTDVLFEQPVHEVVEPSLQRAGIPLLQTGVPIHHYGRLNKGRTREKAEQYAAIGRAKLAASGAGDFRAVRELAAQEQELGNHAQAIHLWERVLEGDPSDARAELGLGVSLVELQRYQEAQRAFERAMRLDQSLREAFVKYALVTLALGDALPALRVLEDAQERHGDYPFAVAARAAALACAGRRDEANRVVNELTRRGVSSSGFFKQVILDLELAGQEAFAQSLMELLHPTARIPVES
ncbi:MAG: glycosyltransferase [Bacteroidetes bacterium]|nr:glycosyltransferase [Bacteroidota bacterium]